MTLVVDVAWGATRVVCGAVAEIRVRTGLLGGESVCRVILEQRLQELTTSLFQPRNNLNIGALPLGEGGLVIGE